MNIPINIIKNILNEIDLDIVTVEIVNNKDFPKSDTKIHFFESIEELKYPQDYDDGSIIILAELNEKRKNDPRLQAMFKRSRHTNLSIFIFSQDYYELTKKRFELMKLSITSLNQINSQTFVIFIKIKLPWI